jgi:hypothetical protein
MNVKEAGREWKTEKNTQRRNNLVFFTFGFGSCCRRRVSFKRRIKMKAECERGWVRDEMHFEDNHV